MNFYTCTNVSLLFHWVLMVMLKQTKDEKDCKKKE